MPDPVDLESALDLTVKLARHVGRTIQLPLESGDRYFELSVARKAAAGAPEARFIMLSRDITERKAAEAELRQRNRELERFNRAAIERELRMVALKHEVNELQRAAGRSAPYDTSFGDLADSRGLA